MLKSVRLKNFFGFRDVKIDLHPCENILIGINGSGKSNFFKAIQLLKEGVAEGGLKRLIFNKWGGFDNICFSDMTDRNEAKDIILEYQFAGDVIKNFGFQFTEDVYYRISICGVPGQSNYHISEKMYLPRQDTEDFIYISLDNGSGVLFGKDADDNRRNLVYQNLDPQELALSQVKDPEHFFIQHTIQKAISEIMAYHYFDTTPVSKIRKPMFPTSEKKLLSDGSNLPQILNILKINHRSHFKKILEKLNEVNEHYKDINFNMIGGNIELMMEEENLGRAIHVNSLSDGTLHFLCLLSIFYNPNRGNLICIDEPETGLHPDMIFNIINAIHDISDETQMMIATHSENVVNGFSLENIRVFEKSNKNETSIGEYSEEDFEGWYDEYCLVGKRWRQGDFGGNRW